MELSQCRILISGGARGIGNFIATELLERAEHVFILDNHRPSLDALPAHEKLTSLQCDVTNPVEVEQVINALFEHHGGINTCINNAGIIHNEPLVNLLSKGDKKHSITNWKKVMSVNLDGVFYVTANVAERMISRRSKGVIINISSISAQGNIGQSAYSASKAAVEALTKTWSKELGMFKIRCACIAPGFYDTASTRDNLSEAMVSKWQKAVPLLRLGELNELLSAVEFIIKNEYFNGKILAIDGGLNL